MFQLRRKNDPSHRAIFCIAAFLFLTAAGTAVFMIRHYCLYGGWAIDNTLLNYSISIRTPWLDDFFRMITATGETLPVILATLGIIVLLLKRGKWGSAAFTGFYMIGVWLLNELLKRLLQRPRPPFELHLAHATGYSLPSGHSMNFMALVLLGLYMLWCFSKEKSLYRSAALFFIPFALLVGISRIYLHVHYFSDVITGWSVGIAWAAFFIMLHLRIATKKSVL